jgi:hypothetical protein
MILVASSWAIASSSTSALPCSRKLSYRRGSQAGHDSNRRILLLLNDYGVLSSAEKLFPSLADGIDVANNVLLNTGFHSKGQVLLMAPPH